MKLAFDLAWLWKTVPDHFLSKPLSELLQDHDDSVAFLDRNKGMEMRP